MDHVGLNAHRLNDNPEERRFAEAWRGMQAGRLLDWLLTGIDQRGYPDCASTRDEQVAATVVQWLGSPVGQGFLRDLGYERAEEKGA